MSKIKANQRFHDRTTQGDVDGALGLRDVTGEWEV